MTRPATIALEAARPRDVFHAVAAERLQLGYVTCGPGEPLCGITAALQPCPDGLFPPSVTCPQCATLAARENITVSGTVTR